MSVLREFRALLAVFLLIFLLAVPSTLTNLPARQYANAQSNSNCPANDVFRMTLYPAPNSLNALTSAVFSSFELVSLEYLTVFPFDLGPGGSPLWNISIVNSVTSNSNYTRWTFNIPGDLKWSNGLPVTSQDILGTYNSSFALNPQYDFVGAHSEIKSEFALNTTAAVFILNMTDAHFAEKISSVLFTPVYPSAVYSQGSAYPDFGTNVADGPFYVSNYTSGQTQMVLLRNPYFKPLPQICEIDVNFVETASQAPESLISGQSDLAGTLEAGDIAAVLRNPSVHILDEKGQQITTLEYNTTSYPFNDTTFRQALAYGINYSSILNQAFDGYAAPATQGVVPSTSPLYNPNTQQYSYNQSRATSLLSSIGIKMGSDGYLQYSNGTDVVLNLWTDNEHTQDLIAAGLLQTQWQNLGFKVNLQVVSASGLTGDFSSNIGDIQHGVTLWSSGGPFFPSPWLDAQPGCNVYWRPGVCNSHWESPPSADAQYRGNLSAIDSTANLTLETQDLRNIQALNAEFLPTIVLGYSDYVWGYSTQRWTDWPSADGYIYSGAFWNTTAMADLTPVGSSTTTTSSLSVGSTTSGSVSSTAVTTGNSTSLFLIAGIVIAIIIIGGIVTFVMRRRPKT